MYTSTAKPVKKPSTANLGSSNLGTSTATAKKKVEGYDLGRSRPDALARSKLDGTKASNIGSNFNQNVERLKNTNAQQVEEEYIGALQEEIKILEYQMKILKDKEIEQQAAVSQIDKFFSDGVPLNDNILALKTQYQNRKADAERLLELTRRQLILVEKEISDLRAEIEVYKNQTKQIEVEHAKRDVDYKKIIDDIKKAQYHERHTKHDLERSIRELQDEFKRFTDMNLKINRDLEKDRVLSTHKSETALSIRNKLERDIEFKDGKIKEIGEHIDKLNGAMALNPQVKRVEQENQELMRRCLNCEKEISMANAKIKEAQMLLEARAKEREQESLLKRELLHNIDLKKMEIDEARKMNELIIAQKVKEKEEADIREKNKEIKKVEDKIDQLKNRIALEEEGISTISQDKVTIQQDIIENEQIKETLEKDLGLARKKAHDLKIMYDFYSDREKTLSAKVEPLANATQKLQAIIPSYEQEIKHYEEQLAMFDKQIEFSKQIKALNFDEVKVLNSSNSNVNTSILDFIKKYEDIQRMSKLNQQTFNK